MVGNKVVKGLGVLAVVGLGGTLIVKKVFDGVEHKKSVCSPIRHQRDILSSEPLFNFDVSELNDGFVALLYDLYTSYGDKLRPYGWIVNDLKDIGFGRCTEVFHAPVIEAVYLYTVSAPEKPEVTDLIAVAENYERIYEVGNMY